MKYFVADSMMGPYECMGNGFLTGPKQDGLYSGRLIKGPDQTWYLLAFMGNDAQGQFVGNIIDPIKVLVAADGSLSLAH